MHWYKRDPDAALNGMAELTLEERGAYNSILDLLYSRDGNVPDDDVLVARMIRVHWRTWAAMKRRLIELGKVWLEDGKITARRVQDTLREASELSEKQRRNASRRWQKSENINKINETPMPSGNASTTTTTTTSREDKKDIGHRSDDLEFDTFWKAYPRKVAKKAAQKAFMKARKETNIESILASLNAQISGWNDPQYIPHPATWLNGGRWADETISSKGKGNGKSENGILAALDDTRERIRSLGLRNGAGQGHVGLLPQGGSQRSANVLIGGSGDAGQLPTGSDRPSNPSANGITEPHGFHADAQGTEIRARARDSET